MLFARWLTATVVELYVHCSYVQGTALLHRVQLRPGRSSKCRRKAAPWMELSCAALRAFRMTPALCPVQQCQPSRCRTRKLFQSSALPPTRVKHLRQQTLSFLYSDACWIASVAASMAKLTFGMRRSQQYRNKRLASASSGDSHPEKKKKTNAEPAVRTNRLVRKPRSTAKQTHAKSVPAASSNNYAPSSSSPAASLNSPVASLNKHAASSNKHAASSSNYAPSFNNQAASSNRHAASSSNYAVGTKDSPICLDNTEESEEFGEFGESGESDSQLGDDVGVASLDDKDDEDCSSYVSSARDEKDDGDVNDDEDDEYVEDNRQDEHNEDDKDVEEVEQDSEQEGEESGRAVTKRVKSRRCVYDPARRLPEMVQPVHTSAIMPFAYKVHWPCPSSRCSRRFDTKLLLLGHFTKAHGVKAASSV
ncbi:hypothetical protein BDV95DRAFT_93652 [Massariosphaeria phaeospora]|uniref:C2H2-type domain-containing protein n=1 Tax=Massariosphaeria phaeospora TaxID=100035 RepID=A0A7C8MLP7_9PLEO|nr:hypothetical protein BDV95DRAFT_93652 [Massariosphaeria phaeospora]